MKASKKIRTKKPVVEPPIYTVEVPPFDGMHRCVFACCENHRTQPYKVPVSWYPFEEYRVRVFVVAKHRRHACKQITRAGVNGVRDLVHRGHVTGSAWAERVVSNL